MVGFCCFFSPPAPKGKLVGSGLLLIMPSVAGGYMLPYNAVSIRCHRRVRVSAVTSKRCPASEAANRQVPSPFSMFCLLSSSLIFFSAERSLTKPQKTSFISSASLLYVAPDVVCNAFFRPAGHPYLPRFETSTGPRKF